MQIWIVAGVVFLAAGYLVRRAIRMSRKPDCSNCCGCSKGNRKGLDVASDYKSNCHFF